VFPMSGKITTTFISIPQRGKKVNYNIKHFISF
jgi:hypothetical protein